MNKIWLNKRMKAVGIESQEALAISAGMRKSAISEILVDTRKIKFTEACKLASLLKCSLDELYFAYTGKQAEGSAINRILLTQAIKDSLYALQDPGSTEETKALIISLRYNDLIKLAIYEQTNISS